MEKQTLKKIGWLLSAVAAAALVFARPLSERFLTQASIYELAAVLAAVILAGFNLGKISAFFSLHNIRRVIRIKAGFTFVFCVLCALLLLIAGWFYPRPEMDQYDIRRLVPGETGYCEPPVFLPGREVKLSVYASQRRIHSISMDGLWKAFDLSAELIVEGQAVPIPLAGAFTVDTGESWDDEGEETNIRYYRGNAGVLNAPAIANKPFFPWIKFVVPADQALKGKQAVVHVRMTVRYPYLLSPEKYDTAEFKLDEKIPLRISSDSEYAAYQRYLLELLEWEQFRKIRMYALLVFCAFALFLKLTVKFIVNSI
jgi:hypothetical protein